MRDEGVVVQVHAGTFPDVPVELLERAVRWTLDHEGVEQAEVSLTLLGDAAIQELNRGYLGHDEPTDVISFSLGDAGAPMGDVYVGAEQATRQAVEHGVSRNEELARLAVHGTLHVLGYDHPDGAERLDSPMFAVQEAIVSRLTGGDAG